MIEKAAAFLHVAIPSMGRAGKMKSSAVLPSASVYVPVREVTSYRQAHPALTIVGVPDEVKGITATRNWILDRCRSRWLVFIDDDVKQQGWIQLRHKKAKHRAMTEAQWLREWTRLACVAEDLNYRLFGVATHSAPRGVYPWRPFIFHTYVTASCMGIRVVEGFRFDETFKVKEDYELCLRAIKEDGGILGARHVYYENSHWKDKGGCAAYRTQEMEEAATQKLMKLYPGMIRSVTRGGSGYSIDLEF